METRMSILILIKEDTCIGMNIMWMHLHHGLMPLMFYESKHLIFSLSFFAEYLKHIS